MRDILAVFNSDQVNSQGYIMPLPVLCSALEQGWSPGQPMFLSHDRHRLQGWTVALGLHLESGLARLTGISLLPQTDEESENIRRGLIGFLARQQNAEVSPHRAELEVRLAPHLRGASAEIYVDAAALIEPGLAQRAFSDVFSQADKDGLVPVAPLHAIAAGVYERDGLLLFASDYFRRSLSRHNTLNDAVLSRLQALAENPKLTVKVRLDPDLVALAGTYRNPLEFAHWWGPKFNDDLLSIPRAITRYEASDRQRFFSGVLRAEFWWHGQNDLQTLECEELRDIPSFGVNADTFGCRYAHSIITPDVNLPTHLDGAVRVYTEEAMLERMDKDMYKAGRHTEYVKLWRVDGPLDVPTWKELITHHFRDNELVGEYLGGVDDSDHVRPHIVTLPANTLATYVPTNMEAGMGVRVHVSYHDRPAGEVPEFAVVPFDTFTRDGVTKLFVESDTYEIVKLLRRGGKAVVLPDNALRIAFEDTAINLAVIRHGGPAAAVNAGQTLAAVAKLCDAWVSRGDDRVVTFCFDVGYADRLVRYSFAGHVVDLQRFLADLGLALPASVTDVPAWADRAYASMRKLFPKARDNPPLAEMLKPTGVLQLKRQWIEPQLYELRFDAERGVPVVNFAIPRANQTLCDLLTAGRISWASAHAVEKSCCSRCGTDYLTCECSKYLDPVHQQMVDAPLLGMFWSNRPADDRSHIVLGS